MHNATRWDLEIEVEIGLERVKQMLEKTEILRDGAMRGQAVMSANERWEEMARPLAPGNTPATITTLFSTTTRRFVLEIETLLRVYRMSEDITGTEQEDKCYFSKIHIKHKCRLHIPPFYCGSIKRSPIATPLTNPC